LIAAAGECKSRENGKEKVRAFDLHCVQSSIPVWHPLSSPQCTKSSVDDIGASSTIHAGNPAIFEAC
jgi:hypothetical protein